MRNDYGNERAPLWSSRGLFYGGLQWPKKAVSNAVDVVTTVLLPWLVFTLVVCLFVFAYEEYGGLVWALLASSSLLALLFVAMGASSGKTWHLALGVLTLGSIGIACGIGFSIQTSFMLEYWHLDNGAVYRHMSPTDPGAMHADASVLEFQDGTMVDVQHSVGYMKAGSVYCAAPVISQRVQGPVQYWAVGRDCCGMRGSFACADAEDAAALSAVVVQGDENFKTAVRMLRSVYDITNAQPTPVFLKWTAKPVEYKDTLWMRATTLVTIASVVHLICAFLTGFVLYKCLPR